MYKIVHNVPALFIIVKYDWGKPTSNNWKMSKTVEYSYNGILCNRKNVLLIYRATQIHV